MMPGVGDTAESKNRCDSFPLGMQIRARENHTNVYQIAAMISTCGQDGVIGPGFILLPETIKHLDKIYEIIIFKILDIKQRRHNNP